MRLCTNLQDMYMYVFSRRVLGTLESQPGLASIKGELLPPIVRSQDLNETGALEVGETV